MSRRLGDTSGMALGTALSRATGVLRDICLIAAIGTGVFADTYSVANSIPNIIYILVAGGAINAVFVPAVVRHMADDPDGGRAFIDRLFTVVVVVLAGIVLLAVAGAGLLVRGYATSQWSAADFHTGTVFAYWCLPQVLFYGMYTLAAQVLNARNVFIAPMFAPIANNIIVITTALTFIAVTDGPVTSASVTGRELALLGAGTTLGVMVQATLLVPALRAAGLRPRLRWDPRGSGLGKVGDLAIWTMGFVLVNQASFLVISRLTTYANVLAADAGAVASGFTTYQKAQLMMMLPHAVITVSIITALLPQLSRRSHDHDMQGFGTDVAAAARWIAALLVPCAVLLALTGPALGVILYGHGASDVAQGIEVGRIAAVFAIGLPGFSLFYLLLRTYYAQEDTRTPFFINLGFNVLHLAIGVTAFTAVAQPDKVAALAAGYSSAYLITSAVTWHRVSGRLPELRRTGLGRFTVLALAAAGGAGGAGWLAHQLVASRVQGSVLTGAVADAVITAGVFTIAYLLLASRARVIDLRQLRGFLSRGSSD